MNDFWNGRSVLVTGATGLLGSHMVRALLEHDGRVTCLVRDWVPESLFLSSSDHNRVRIVRGELEDYFAVLRTLNEYEVDTVFHLGAQAIVGAANRSVLSTFESNIKGTWNVLEAARACPQLVKRVVVASSDKAYGEHAQLPYTEDLPLQGRFPYDASKACAELICQSYYHTYDLPVVVTRCGNLYGAGDLNFNRLIPGTIRSALQGEQPVIRSDGKFLRDYFYVEDAVNAYLRCAEQLESSDLAGEAFNFGTEEPLSVVEVVDCVLKRMGREDLVPIIRNDASHEIREQYLDCTKARDRLDWRPRYSFEAGLKPTIEWYRKYLQAAG